MSVRPSIRRRLLVMLISAILLVWLLVSLLVYRAARDEVEVVFDAELARSAQTLQTLLLHEVLEERDMHARVRSVREELGAQGMAAYPRLAEMIADYLEREGKERLELVRTTQEAGDPQALGLFFIARFADGSTMMTDRAAPDIGPMSTGYVNLHEGDDDWRIFSLTEERTGFTVQVGERLAYRAGLARAITRNTLVPLLVALPVLALSIWIIVGRALAPLEQVAAQVARRAPDVLDPIDEGAAPNEVQGLIHALNKLFGKVSTAIVRERQFTADAAHELRTPLAAMKTHLQIAQARIDEPGTRRSIGQALEGVDRATHSVEQLLSLARADAGDPSVPVAVRLDLGAIAAAAVSRYSQQAHERGIDLGLGERPTCETAGDEAALQVMLRNLVDNAVRYTPRGGTVTVSTGRDGGGCWIEVADDGPGVPSDEQERIFDRFHRGPQAQRQGTTGSGLGLSIVRRIAELHGADVHLGTGLNGRGLAVRVVFPV